MIGPRALFGSAFALIALGAAMGLTEMCNTARSSTLAEANAVGASSAQLGTARNSGDSSVMNPAGKRGVVAAAWSIVENDMLTTGTTGASPSAFGLLGGAGTGDRAADLSVGLPGRSDAEPARAETGAAPKAKEAQTPKSAARAGRQKPAVSVTRSQGLVAQRRPDARPAASPVASGRFNWLAANWGTLRAAPPQPTTRPHL
ncbi:MAG: hypothetical protein M3145_11055 [Pseudomonadota bacterium]|nr:hypothetical protein [Pseudomonadota bacterium]